jgi:hypothetical protein
MDDLRAVMDAVGSERAALLGTSEAGALNLLFSATHPDRTAALILLNSYARLTWAEDYPHGIPPSNAEQLLEVIESGWGKGVAFEALVASQADNEPMRQWWARYQRQAASPGTAVTLLRRAFDTDARGVLSSITVPTLVLHKTGDPFTGPEHGRYLAENVPAARYVELAGVDHLFFAEDSDRLVAEIQEFLTGVRDQSEPIEFSPPCFSPTSWARPIWQPKWAIADGRISSNPTTARFAPSLRGFAERKSVLLVMACLRHSMVRRVQSDAAWLSAKRCVGLVLRSASVFTRANAN